MMHGKPLGTRKIVQLMVILTILAWATQTLFHQWGYGQEQRVVRVPTLEVREQATAPETQIKLKDVVRWSEADAATFAPLADVMVGRCDASSDQRLVSEDEIRGALHDAGLSLADINLCGAKSCSVARADNQCAAGEDADNPLALAEWAET